MPGRSLDALITSARYFDDNIMLVIMGEQNAYFREVLLPLASEPDVSDRVSFLPFVAPDRVMDYVGSADLGVVIYSNSSLNNFLCAPTKLYEFIMAKVPVITCNFPVMLEVLAEFPIGTTFEPSDPHSIAGAVNSYFALSRGEQQRIEASLSSARQRFNWERESTALLRLLRSSGIRCVAA
jgi:glycosyltransferase involved in cell wall biosynthesis